MEEKKMVKILGMTMSESEIRECISSPLRMTCTHFPVNQWVVAAPADIQSIMEANKTRE